MKGEDLKFLAKRADAVRGRPDQRLAEVHARIRSARRRRAAGGVAATSAVVLALVIGIAVLTGSTARHTDNGQAPPANPDTPMTSTTREIVYSDDLEFVAHDAPTALLHVGTIHVGDREVDIDQTLHTVRTWALQVTDAGVVYAQDDHSVWFTDGGEPQQIAEQACVYTGSEDGLATGDAGPLASWFDCTPGSRGDLVVFDTGSGHEVSRHLISSCRAVRAMSYGGCGPVDVIGEHVYFTSAVNNSNQLIDHQFRLDVTSDQVTPADPQMYADDLRTHARALVIGDSWQTGNLTDGEYLTFSVEGSRLVPLGDVHSERAPRAFDAATGQPVRLRLPGGYHPDPETIADAGTDSFTFFQWLDDDTIALAQGIDNTKGDLITCRLSDGSCHLAVKAAPPDQQRIVAGGSLPG